MSLLSESKVVYDEQADAIRVSEESIDRHTEKSMDSGVPPRDGVAILTFDTVLSFPIVGDSSKFFKAADSQQVYFWNEALGAYQETGSGAPGPPGPAAEVHVGFY